MCQVQVLAACLVATSALSQPQPSGQPEAARGWRPVKVAEGIRHPWGLAWLPDGRAILTAKHGTLHVLNGDRFEEIPTENLPKVYSENQAGLLDIAVHPKDKENVRLYLTMSTGTSQENRVTLVRGIFDGKRASQFQTLFQAEPAKTGGEHFGSRLVWLPDGTLLMSIGDGGNPPRMIEGMLAREQAQNLDSHLGSVLRLTEDGKPAPGNPFLDREGARPEIWSYGHRNIQGMVRDPASGRIWVNEHGPLGGDELNLVEKGRNYGWPLQTLGRDYRTGQTIGRPSVPGMATPKVIWTPAHAPSGLAFYTGDKFPNWRGSLLSGGLISQDIRRIALDKDGNVIGQERLSIGSRVRDVRQGPDGHIYAITDEENGRLLRIEPE
jgi:aldose sugar dehydrogenase